MIFENSFNVTNTNTHSILWITRTSFMEIRPTLMNCTLVWDDDEEEARVHFWGVDCYVSSLNILSKSQFTTTGRLTLSSISGYVLYFTLLYHIYIFHSSCYSARMLRRRLRVNEWRCWWRRRLWGNSDSNFQQMLGGGYGDQGMGN